MQHGVHKLIMPVCRKAHWLLREAKAAAWVNLSLDLLLSAREVTSRGHLELFSVWDMRLCWAQSVLLAKQNTSCFVLFYKKNRI